MNKIHELYLAAGCFWGTEKLFSELPGVVETECGYANGKPGIVPSYERVCRGDTGFRETVRVAYDAGQISLQQLLAVYFYVVDPTVFGRQGNDIGDQYQTGIYTVDEASQAAVADYAAEERKKYAAFEVELLPLQNFYPAEEMHQDYLNKHPGGYCHISPKKMAEAKRLVTGEHPGYHKPDDAELRRTLTREQYDVTQRGSTEMAFTGKYWKHREKGIYVDVTTGQPLFSSADKYDSSCGWPSFCAPIDEDCLVYRKDYSYGMARTEVRSEIGEAHLGHVFLGEPESPNGVRYCINSASLRFIPYEELEAQGYGAWKCVFD